MSFFLLSRAEDGGLRLLSDTAFPSLKEARRELSRVTGDSGFEGWDDEVFVIDLGSATPILLVRPASAEAADEAAPDEDVDESAQVEDEIAAVREELETGEAEPTLKDALRRTTVQLEAEGITAPESVGPAEDEPPQDDSAEGEPSESAQETGSGSGGSDDAAAWPWDTAAADDRPFDLDALEEPRDENESLVRAPGDEETMAVAHPVILGSDFAPASTEEELSSADGAPAEAAPEPAADAIEKALPVEDTLVEPQEDEPVETSDADAVDHGPEFVIEHEPDTSVSGEPETTASLQDVSESIVVETPESTGAESDFIDLGDIASMTCDDCVYAETCPNRGQMLPTSCGSFQWK